VEIGAGEGAPRRSALEVAKGAYSLGAFGLWGVLLWAILNLGGPLLTRAGELTTAITRASVALEHVAQDAGASREALARLEVDAARQAVATRELAMELAEVRRVTTEIRGSVAGCRR
jgi:hypothetical protein